MAKPTEGFKSEPDASGVDLAYKTVGSFKVPVVTLADFEGHLIGSRDEWLAYYAPQTNAANRSVADLFNADAAVLVRVRGIWIIPNLASVTGAALEFAINKVSAVGTGGTVVTPRPPDSAQAAIDADITARRDATGGNTLAHLIWSFFTWHEETAAPIALAGMFNQIPIYGDRIAEIVLHQNEGVQVKQGAAAVTSGGTGALIHFTTET